MSPRIQVEQPASDGSTFAPDAFASQIGKTVRLNIEGAPASECKVVAAEVAEDGASVVLTLEVPDDVMPAVSLPADGFSLR